VALYYQHDQYGSTRLLTNQAGAIAATYTYTAYGTLTTHTGTADTPLRWNGQYQDSDTGLYYLRARYYNPVTAQFLTRDPLEALTGSVYGFADNDPLNGSDPTGLCGPACFVIAGAVIGAGIDLGTQAIGNIANGCNAFDNINWGSVAASGLAGGIAGLGGAWFEGAAEGAGALEQGAARVPSAWGDGVANSKGVGTRWFDPASKGNGIRIDEGIPGSSFPSQQVDHVVVRYNGRILGPDGQPITGSLRDNPGAHIPLSDWLNWSSWFAP
jgi:RHS repeat-associated protein